MLRNIVNELYLKRAMWGELSWVVVGQAAAVLGAIVGVKLLTDALPPQVYGELALAMTAATLVNQVTLWPLSNAFLRFYAPAEEAGEQGSYLAAVGRLSILGAGPAVGIVLATVTGAWLLGCANWIPLLVATALFALVSGYNGVMDGIQNAARHRSVVALHQGVGQWLRFLCAVGLIGAAGAGSTVAMSGYCVGSLILFASQAWFFQREIVRPAGTILWTGGALPEWRERIFAYAWPLSLWGSVAWLQFSSDRWALGFFGNTSDVGLYSALYQLGFYPQMVISAVASQLLTPLFSQWAGDGTDAQRRQLVASRSRLVALVGLGISLCYVLAAVGLHNWVFRFLTAEEYRSVSWLLPAQALAGALYGAAYLSGIGLMCNFGSRSLLMPKLCTAILGVVLNVVGAAVWGLPGVVAAGIIAYGTCLMWMLILNATWSAASSRLNHGEVAT